jgi:hypothetical protein
MRTPDTCLTHVFVPAVPTLLRMRQDQFEGEEVTIELDAEELELVDDIAFSNHRDNRDAAIRTLLDEWLKNQDD